jgi:hypothetical protein
VLAAVSTPAAPREAVTVTDSLSDRGCSTIRDAAASGVTDSAKPSARTLTVAPADVELSMLNRPSVPLFALAISFPPASMVTVAPATGAPDASMTIPAVALLCARIADAPDSSTTTNVKIRDIWADDTPR